MTTSELIDIISKRASRFHSELEELNRREMDKLDGLATLVDQARQSLIDSQTKCDTAFRSMVFDVKGLIEVEQSESNTPGNGDQ